jgi:hypothetical protein
MLQEHRTRSAVGQIAICHVANGSARAMVVDGAFKTRCGEWYQTLAWLDKRSRRDPGQAR